MNSNDEEASVVGNKKAKACREKGDSNLFPSSWNPSVLISHEIIYDNFGKPINYKFIDMNNTFEGITGIKKNDFLGKTVLDLLPNLKKSWIEVFAKVAITGQPYYCEDYSEYLDKYVSIFAYSPAKGRFNILLTEISANKRMDGNIENEDKYHLLLENCHDIIYTFDINMTISYVSPAVECLLGYSVSQVMGMSLESFLHPDDLQISWDSVEEMMISRTGKRNLEVRVRHIDGTWRWYSANLTIITSDAGNGPSFEGVARDITERKNIEEIKKTHEKHIKDILKATQDGFLAVRDEGIIYDVNDAYCKMTGYTKEELLGRKILEIEAVESEEELIARGKKIKEQGADLFETWHRRKDGSIMAVEVSVACLNAEPYIGVCFCRDITGRKKTEQHLYVEKEKFKTTLLSVGDGVISTDTKGNIIIMNKAAERLTGWCKDDVVGSFIGGIIRMVNSSTGDNYDCCVQKVLESSCMVNFSSDCVLISKTGKKLAVEGNASPIRDLEGKVRGVVIVMRDSTEKKKRQAEIEYLSFYDQLTGVYNRRFFEEEIKRRNIESNFPLTIAILDVNGLKLANDAFGHSQGDKILREVTNAIIAESRSDDIIARIGGDEFVILFPKTSYNQAQIIIDRMRRAIGKEKVNNINLSVSFGWSTKTEISQELQKILIKAEDNMYSCKLSESPGIKYKTIDILMKTLYERSKSEEKHSKLVSKLCEKMGIAMGLPKAGISELKLFGLMHDIGKIAVSEDILNKPEQLNHPEWLQIRRHSETGYRILSSVNEFSLIAEYVLAHHERWDGRGYPKRLSGNKIPVQARILSVVDAYAAMTGICPYHEALDKEEAIEEIKNKAGSQFDPDIARIFVERVLGSTWD